MAKLRALRRASPAGLLGLGLVAALQGRAAAQIAPGQPWTQDDQWADVVSRVPGFGGYWREGSTLVLALADTTQRAAALYEFTRLHPGDEPTKVRIQSVKYDFAQLYAWKQLASQYLGDSTGPFEATLTDADELHNRLLVWVRDSSDLAPARSTLAASGVPPDALELEVGEVVPLPLEQALPNPRMQPTGRRGPGLRSGAGLPVAK
jgi:hypothetical protein